MSKKLIINPGLPMGFADQVMDLEIRLEEE